MLEDIRRYDFPPKEPLEHVQTCTKRFMCKHTDCPVRVLEEVGRDMEAEGFINTNRYGDVTRCDLMRVKGRAAWSFLARVGVVLSALGVLGTAVTAWGIAACFAVAGVAFYGAERWLEGKK